MSTEMVWPRSQDLNLPVLTAWLLRTNVEFDRAMDRAVVKALASHAPGSNPVPGSIFFAGFVPLTSQNP